MGDPDAVWLSVTNMVLGGAVAAFVVLVLAGIMVDRLRRHRRSVL